MGIMNYEIREELLLIVKILGVSKLAVDKLERKLKTKTKCTQWLMLAVFRHGYGTHWKWKYTFDIHNPY